MATRAGATSSQDQRYSKGQVNRAGKHLLELRGRGLRDGVEVVLAETDDDDLTRAYDVLAWWRSRYARPRSNVAAGLRYHVDQADGRVAGRMEVTQRLKRMETLLNKLGREPGNVTQMHDIGGVRAVLPNLRALYAVRRRLLKSWTIVRPRDYIAEPKQDGYRAVHLIVARNGVPIEVQLRTMLQDAWANLVERQGRELGTGYKFGGGSAETRSRLASIAELAAALDRDDMSAQEFARALRDMR